MSRLYFYYGIGMMIAALLLIGFVAYSRIVKIESTVSRLDKTLYLVCDNFADDVETDNETDNETSNDEADDEAVEAGSEGNLTESEIEILVEEIEANVKEVLNESSVESSDKALDESADKISIESVVEILSDEEFDMGLGKCAALLKSGKNAGQICGRSRCKLHE